MDSPTIEKPRERVPPTLYALTQDHAAFVQIQDAAAPWPVEWVDGREAPSFSWLVNQAIKRASGEVVLCTSDRCRPTASHCAEMLQLLQDGFGFVGLYRFACFGISMDLLRRIGPLDERFLGGGYEDCDFMFRCCEADIAMYEAEHAPFLGASQSRWASLEGGALEHFQAKWAWSLEDRTITRRLEESPWEAAMHAAHGEDQQTVFKHWSESQLLPPSMWTLTVRPTLGGV